MTKLIGPKFCEGLHMSPGKVYGGSTFKTFAIYYKIRFFAFVYNVHKEKMFKNEIEDGGSALKP